MVLAKSVKLAIIIGVSTAVVAAAVVPTTVILVRNNTIYFDTLYNAGIMIETKGIRIYIDPIDLSDDYEKLPADVILITHDHGDHYQQDTIDMLQKENTVNVFPAIMSSVVTLNDGMGVVPLDNFQIEHVNITCFYMYTFPPEGYESSHPIESQYVSYIIDVEGFVFFHAGDSSDIPEYSNLRGDIDVAMLPLGPGCQTMCDIAVVNAIGIISPDYFVPIHYADEMKPAFMAVYTTFIENYDCEIIDLDYWSSYKFSL